MGDLGEVDRGVSRREALRLTAKAAGVAAFATPVVVGAFSAPALGQAPVCDGSTASDVILAVLGGDFTQNQNCGGDNVAPPYGRYNAQKATFTVAGQTGGQICIGICGTTDNLEVEQSWYTIVAPQGYVCSAYFTNDLCPKTPGSGFIEMSSVPLSAPPGALPLPYCFPTGKKGECEDNAGNKLVLDRVECCPI